MTSFRDIIRPWLEGERENDAGEIGFHCPLPGHHPDRKRSGSVNFSQGVYHCPKCGGGQIKDLAEYLQQHPELKVERGPHRNGRAAHGSKAPLNEGQVAGWAGALLGRSERLDYLVEERGLTWATIQDFQIGWNANAGNGAGAYTIPVRDAEGKLLNVRFYRVIPEGDESSKIWGLPGRNEPVLFPGQVLADLGNSVVICEGEWDALLTIQNGFSAVTRTGAANVWKPAYNAVLQGKVAYLCHDADKAGQDGNRIAGASLEGTALEINCVKLPYAITEKHGKDLTDYWLEGHSPTDFYNLLFEAEPWGPLVEAKPRETRDVTVQGSFSAEIAGAPQRLSEVTVIAQKDQSYLVPELVTYNCDKAAGAKCASCRMNGEGFDGHHELRIPASDPDLLKCLDATEKQITDLLYSLVVNVPGCRRVKIEVAEQRSVERLYVRDDDKKREVISVGHYDTMANNTIELVGATFPSPRDQHNTFLAWELNHIETSIDTFALTSEQAQQLQVFRPSEDQTPLQKLGVIAKDLSHHVTKIYGRPEMHALMDLVFHSVLAFYFNDGLEPRGWLDAIIVGDTRTGKTKAAQQLIQLYRCGVHIGCEAASFSGVIGGLEQFNGKDWVVSWGALPVNDRRLVVLDEVSGLKTEQIAQMSGARSSGMAEIRKIHSEQTHARTRLLWLANPRHGKSMQNYTYGIEVLPEVIGNNEDVARFDIAMSVAMGDVPGEDIYDPKQKPPPPRKFNPELCATLCAWAWSRKPEQIRWGPGAEAQVYAEAMALGQRYVPEPPLVQEANVDTKIARLAVALAARLFSTPDGENLLVTKAHVRDAVRFMDKVYNMPGFGYATHSTNVLGDREAARINMEECKNYLLDKIEFARLLRDCPGTFRRSSMEDMLAFDKTEANIMVEKLYGWHMVKQEEHANVRIMPELHQVLREVFER